MKEENQDIKRPSDTERGNGLPGNAEDESKTFDIYHVKSRWSLIFLVLFILALLALLLYALLTGGPEAV